MKKILSILLVLTFTILFTGCEDKKDENVVYVTSYPTYYLVESLAKNTVTIKYVPGTAAHSGSYDWSPKELIDMLDSELLIHIGNTFDPYIDSNLEVFEGENVKLVKLQDHIEFISLCYSQQNTNTQSNAEQEVCKDALDPHFWLDISKAIEAAEIIKNELILQFPDNADIYNTNYLVLVSLLENLDDDFKQAISSTPSYFISTSNVFNYWDSAYDSHTIPLTNSSHSGEDVGSDYSEIIDTIIANDIHTIFFIYNESSPAGESIVETINSMEDYNVEVKYIHPCGFLSTADIENQKDFVSIMYENINTLNEYYK